MLRRRPAETAARRSTARIARLFATLIFFAVTRLLVAPIDIFEVHPDTPEEAKYLSPDKGFNLQVDSDGVFGSQALQKRWNRFNNLSKSEKAELVGLATAGLVVAAILLR